MVQVDYNTVVCIVADTHLWCASGERRIQIVYLNEIHVKLHKYDPKNTIWSIYKLHRKPSWVFLSLMRDSVAIVML